MNRQLNHEDTKQNNKELSMCKHKTLLMIIFFTVTVLMLHGGFQSDNYYVSAASVQYENYFSHSLGEYPSQFDVDDCPDYISISYNNQSTSMIEVVINCEENTSGEFRDGYIEVTVWDQYLINFENDTMYFSQACHSATNPVQAMIDNASDGDTINLQSGTYTGPLTISNKYLTINGKDTIIQGSGHAPVLNFINSNGSELYGLVIMGGRYENVGGIKCESSDLSISHCEISNNYGKHYYSGGLPTTNYTGGMYISGNSDVEIQNTVFHSNGAYACMGGYNLYSDISNNYEVILVKNTFHVDYASYNLYNNNPSADMILKNCIVANPYSTDIDYTYCCAYNTNIVSFPGIGNIIDDPLFLDDTGPEYDFHIPWGSPCIDAGDPSEEDDDQSPIDMGYCSYDRDQYALCYRYVWKCYPLLDVSDDDNNGENDDYLIPPNIWEEYWTSNPDVFIVWYIEDVDQDPRIEGYCNNGVWNWSEGGTYQVPSWKGFKISSDSYHYNGGYLMDENSTSLFTYPDLPAEQESWMGYYLVDSQYPGDAIDSQVMAELLGIKTQRWSMSRNSINDRWIIPGSYTFNYADCVILVPNSTITGFQWQGSQGHHRDAVEPYIRPRAEHFDFEDEIDYLPIYAEFSPDDIPEEIGIYVNGECKGAQVVEDTLCQICAYVLEEEAGEEIEFVFYDGDRNIYKPDYSVLDNYDGKTISRKLYTGSNKRHQYISFKNTDSNIPECINPVHCYPNPFNPQVNISFELEETSSIELHIYNVKGQLVKTLVDELYRPGKYILNWDGRDNNDTKVSSGVYYYRFTTDDNAYNGKMLMLK